MKLIGSLALAGLTCCVSATALSAADYYVQATTPGPVTGTPLAVVNLQAELKQPANALAVPAYESEAAGRKFVVTQPKQQAAAAAPAAAPVAIKAPVRSFACVAITKKRQIRIRNNKMIRLAPTSPSSSQMIEKIISFWASGRNPNFCTLFPSPLPKRATC